jgi:hypothetical protein
MRNVLLAVMGLALLAGAVSAQQNHDAVYIAGGMYNSSSTIYQKGVNMIDNTGASPVVKQLVQPGSYARAIMDADNKHLLIPVNGTTSTSSLYAGFRNGLFRYNPTTNTVTTLLDGMVSTTAYRSYYHATIDYNGDYLVGVYNYDTAGPTSLNGYRVLKVDPTGVATTAISTTALGRTANFYHRLTTDIDSGKVLVGSYSYQTSPTTMRYPVFSYNPQDGAIAFWSTGGSYGWYGYYNMSQNHRTGNIEGPYASYVYQLKPGTTNRSTLATLTGLPRSLYGGGRHDLQTAANPRFVMCSYTTSPNGGYLYYLDTNTWAVTSVNLNILRFYVYGFDFYQGRHTQTVLTGKRKWKVLFSAPKFPGKNFVAMMGLSGVRPGIPLPDGRNINLNFDALGYVTLMNLIPAIWSGGSGTLDASGEAVGSLDLSIIPQLGMPAWIAWLIYDPAAPGGIAYVPDTYVMRI